MYEFNYKDGTKNGGKMDNFGMKRITRMEIWMVYKERGMRMDNLIMKRFGGME